jgi:hypothetical protein
MQGYVLVTAAPTSHDRGTPPSPEQNHQEPDVSPTTPDENTEHPRPS